VSACRGGGVKCEGVVRRRAQGVVARVEIEKSAVGASVSKLQKLEKK